MATRAGHELENSLRNESARNGMEVWSLRALTLKQEDANWLEFDPNKWDTAPSLLEFGGLIVFPVYGRHGGISTSYLFYVVGVPKGGRERHEARVFGVEVQPTFEGVTNLKLAAMAGMKQAANVLEAGGGRLVNTDGGDLGRGDLVIVVN